MKRMLVFVVVALALFFHGQSFAQTSSAQNQQEVNQGQEISIDFGDNKGSVKIPREFPITVQPPAGPFLSPAPVPSSAKGFNVSLRCWEQKLYWAFYDVDRALRGMSPKVKVKMTTLATLPKVARAEGFDLLSVEKLQKRGINAGNLGDHYDVIANVYAFPNGKENQTFDEVFIAAAERIINETGAPFVVVAEYGFDQVVSVNGKQISLGAGFNILEGGPGNLGGSASAGAGMGHVLTTPSKFPWVVMIAVAPKGNIIFKKEKEEAAVVTLTAAKAREIGP